MPRTDATAVRNIAKVKRSAEDSTLDPFIEAASFLVDKVCADDEDYDDAALELIERWLAAHFYHVFDPRRVQERADVISATYEGKSGLYLDFTRYGQQAKLLDFNGHLAALDAEIKNPKKRITVDLTWLGKECRGTEW